MTGRFSCLVACCLAAIMVSASGCGLSKPYPAKAYYALDVPAPQPIPGDRHDLTLRVASTRIADPFDDVMFHYRMDHARFESDYYVNFIANPSELITGELIESLSASGPYRTVIDNANPAASTRTLECRISALHGDFTGDPRAVVTARFFLLDTIDVDVVVLFNQQYTSSVQLDGNDSASLVRGWNEALHQIFAGLAPDLAAAEAGTS